MTTETASSPDLTSPRTGFLACREQMWLRDVPASCPCPIWRWDGRVMKWHRTEDHYWFCPWGGRL